MIVFVKDRNIDIALRILKKRMQKAAIAQKLQKDKYFISPSQIRAEKKNNKQKTISKILRNAKENKK